MPSRNSLSPPTRQRYPLGVLDLSRAELQSLIKVLDAEPELEVFPFYTKDTHIQIQDSIRILPSGLHKRCSIRSLPCASIPAGTLCATHRRLNPYIISHISRLIKREVEDHLDLVTTWYSGDLIPPLKDTVQCLRSLRGMWCDPISDHTPPSETVPRQQNKCEACMIARVISNLEYLQNLSAALRSRTRERCSARAPPKLSRVIQEALNNRYGGSLAMLDDHVLRISRGLKQARKDAARNKRSHARVCNRTKCAARHLGYPPPAEGLYEHPYIDRPTPERQTSIETVHVCMHPESVSSPRPADRPMDVEEDEEGKRQDQLVNDILNAYRSLSPGWKRAAAALLPTLEDPATPVNQQYQPLNISPSHPSSSTQSDHESYSYNIGMVDDTDIPDSPTNEHLMSQIGNMLVAKGSRAEGEHRPFQGNAEVSPRSSCQSTAVAYLEPDYRPWQN